MAADRASIQALYDELCVAWKTNDAGTVAELFTDDGSLINPFGQRADGRAAITSMYAEYFNGLLAGTTTVATVDTIRPIDADHVFVDGRQTVDAPNGATIFDLHISALVRREHDSWKLVDARPFSLAEPPPQ